MAKVSRDLILQGKEWTDVIDRTVANQNKGNIFPYNYHLFFLATSIGINAGRIIDSFEPYEDQRSIPRTAQSNNAELINYLFETAILSTDCLNMSDNEKLKFVYGNEDFNISDKLDVLLKFANYGLTVIKECISDIDEETIDNLNTKCKKLFSDIDVEELLGKLQEIE